MAAKKKPAPKKPVAKKTQPPAPNSAQSAPPKNRAAQDQKNAAAGSKAPNRGQNSDKKVPPKPADRTKAQKNTNTAVPAKKTAAPPKKKPRKK